MTGKESIAFNDRTGATGDFLKKALDFHFKLQRRKRHRPGQRPRRLGRRDGSTVGRPTVPTLTDSRRLDDGFGETENQVRALAVNATAFRD